MVCTLPVCIIFVKSPCIIYSCRDFPWIFVWQSRDKVISGCHVIAHVVSGTSAQQAVRLNRFYKINQFLCLSYCNSHRSIEPDQADFSVVLKKLFYLWFTFLIEIFLEIFSGVIFMSHISIWIIPVLSL